MNSLEIIQWLCYPAIAYFSFKLGFDAGFDRGNVKGRKTVREFYEQLKR